MRKKGKWVLGPMFLRFCTSFLVFQLHGTEPYRNSWIHPKLLLSHCFPLLKPQAQVSSPLLSSSPTCTPVQLLHLSYFPLSSHHGMSTKHAASLVWYGWEDGSTGTVLPQSLTAWVRALELILARCLLTPTCIPWHTYPHGRNAISFPVASQGTQSDIHFCQFMSYNSHDLLCPILYHSNPSHCVQSIFFFYLKYLLFLLLRVPFPRLHIIQMWKAST